MLSNVYERVTMGLDYSKGESFISCSDVNCSKVYYNLTLKILNGTNIRATEIVFTRIEYCAKIFKNVLLGYRN